MMDDHIRTSEADRERVTARLREHYAEGRLTAEELDERIAAALSATTFADLRRPLADLPEPETGPAPGGARHHHHRHDFGPGWPGPAWQGPGWRGAAWHRHGWRGGPFRRRPRILPLVLIALILALVIPGAGWLFVAFLKVALVLWLVAMLAGIVAVFRFRRQRRRWRQSWQDYGQDWQRYRRHWHQYD